MDFLDYKGVPLGADLDEQTLSDGTLTIADLATPFATISRPAVEANAAAMGEYCSSHGVHLAPHAKTTLAADLLGLQIRNGAWAMTAALPRQVALLWQLGFPRVLLANEVADVRAVDWMAGKLAEDERLALWMYVDSDRGLDLLADGVKRPGAPTRRIGVLVEMGYPGGRTGCRSAAEARHLAERVATTPGLRLAGVAGYEGTIGVTRDAHTVKAVDAYLEQLRDLAAALLERKLLDRPILTAGGSIYFDRVVAMLAGWAKNEGADVVLRSGCYLIHDHGMYAIGTPAACGIDDAPELTAALSVWARVVSQPEPGLALLDAGRRDVSHDAGLPVPLQRLRDGAPIELGADTTVTALSDQHAFLRYPPQEDLQVGDLVRLGISHPCTTLDRHRGIFLIDDAHRIVGAVRTNF